MFVHDNKVAVLFEGWEETMIWSCLQGFMGEVLVDHPENPTSALAKIGNRGAFGFLAGQPNRRLLDKCTGDDIILVPQHQGWRDLIEGSYGKHAHAFTRYATKKDTIFSPQKLGQYSKISLQGVSILPIDKEQYEKCLEQDWSADLVVNYGGFCHYERMGLGFVAVKENEIIAGASSYSTYEGGIELEIDTHPDFRRKGLAKAVAAKLILACLDRSLYPSWDAHTKISLDLAEKLGYEFSHEYVAYEIDW